MQREISIYDLLMFERSREAILTDNYGEFYTILHELGFDVNEEIEVQECLHRPLTALTEIVDTLRWVGWERVDKEWVDSVYCSDENKLRLLGVKDFSFAKQIVEMSRFPDFTQRAMDYLRTGSPEFEYVTRMKDENYGE